MRALATRIDGPVAVIGDVHGYADKLATVLERLRETDGFDRRWLVFIGDFVDRGPDPKSVMEIVTDLLVEHARTTAIAGNHEFALCAALAVTGQDTKAAAFKRYPRCMASRIWQLTRRGRAAQARKLLDSFPGSSTYRHSATKQQLYF